MSKKSRN